MEGISDRVVSSEAQAVRTDNRGGFGQCMVMDLD